MRLRRASTTAGRKFAAAVPEVLRTATGAASCLAMPSAKYAAARSSIRTQFRMSGWDASETASGVDREPGQITALRTPLAAS